MTHKFALTSSGPLSGKSTLARHLRDAYGFILADHSRSLVTAFVESWNSVLPVSERIAVDQVYQEKEVWRGRLQQFGYQTGFNDNTGAQLWVFITLKEWLPDQKRDVVFDSLRGETQANVLHWLGFEVVQIEISEYERCARAAKLNLSCTGISQSMAAHPELELGVRHPDIRLDGSLPTAFQASTLLGIQTSKPRC